MALKTVWERRDDGFTPVGAFKEELQKLAKRSKTIGEQTSKNELVEALYREYDTALIMLDDKKLEAKKQHNNYLRAYTELGEAHAALKQSQAKVAQLEEKLTKDKKHRERSTKHDDEAFEMLQEAYHKAIADVQHQTALVNATGKELKAAWNEISRLKAVVEDMRLDARVDQRDHGQTKRRMRRMEDDLTLCKAAAKAAQVIGHGN